MTVVFSELARHYSYPGDRTAKRINGFPVVLKDLRNFLRSQLYLGPADVALLTFYKSGQGGPRHADDEEGKQGLDLREPITVISLGSPRVVRFTNFQGARTRVDLLTTPGSVYVMKDPLFQTSLKHQLLQGRGGRFSISFRTSKPQKMGRYKEESRDRLASESVRGGRSSPARDMNLEVQKPDAEAVAACLLLEKEREKIAAWMKENRALVKELTNEKRKQSECQVQKMMMEATLPQSVVQSSDLVSPAILLRSRPRPSPLRLNCNRSYICIYQSKLALIILQILPIKLSYVLTKLQIKLQINFQTSVHYRLFAWPSIIASYNHVGCGLNPCCC
jgi:hypothetical protein